MTTCLDAAYPTLRCEGIILSSLNHPSEAVL